MSTLQNYYCHCLCPSSELHPPAPCHPPTCAFSEDPPILADRSDPVSYEVPAFSLGFGVHETLHTFSKSGFPQSCGTPELQPHWPPEPDLLRLPPPIDRPLPAPRRPQYRKPDVGIRAFNLVGKLLCYNCFPVCGLLTWHVWDLILS